MADQRTRDLVVELSDHHYHSNGHGSIEEKNAVWGRCVWQCEQGAATREALNP